eukprot:gene15693-18478_t
MEGEIRLAELSDVPVITDIYNYAVLHTTATQDLHPQTVEVREKWFLAHDPQRLPVFVFEAAATKEVVGWSSLSLFSERPGYSITAEVSIYIAPHAQGKGIGKKMLHHLVAVARDQGFHSLLARMADENVPSKAMHLAAGFQPAGLLKEAGWKFNRYIDIAILQMMLV